MDTLIIIEELEWLDKSSRTGTNAAGAKRDNFDYSPNARWAFRYNGDHLEHELDPDSIRAQYTLQFTSAVLYIKGEGYSEIPYHPYHRGDHCEYWRSIEFLSSSENECYCSTREGGCWYNIIQDGDRVDKTYKTVHKNQSAWFGIFEYTRHAQCSPDTARTCLGHTDGASAAPRLYVQPSLGWALAAHRIPSKDMARLLPMMVSQGVIGRLPEDVGRKVNQRVLVVDVLTSTNDPQPPQAVIILT